jgi:hypothetical protein
MSPYKKFFKDIKPSLLTKVLESLYNEDCYYYDFTKSHFNDMLLHCLEYYGIAFIASDGRVMLTSSGRQAFLSLFLTQYS